MIQLHILVSKMQFVQTFMIDTIADMCDYELASRQKRNAGVF